MKSIKTIEILFFLCFLNISSILARKNERQRIQSYLDNNYTWPPNNHSWQNDSDQFRQKQRIREIEIQSIPGANERWENWKQFVQYQLVPKFTTKSFEVMKVPDRLYRKLKDLVENAIKDWDQIEYETEQVLFLSKLRPKEISIHDIRDWIGEELRSIHERWSGISLELTLLEGIRLYQNDTSFAMHLDKVNSDVISSIIHISHSYEDENHPWPLQIEDHDGVLHEVILQEGEMLLYESARCPHGRLRAFRGKYFASVFLHYKPTDITIWNYTQQDVVDRIPPHWYEGLQEMYGSRWTGSGFSIDSLLADGLPPRVFGYSPFDFDDIDSIFLSDPEDTKEEVKEEMKMEIDNDLMSDDSRDEL